MYKRAWLLIVLCLLLLFTAGCDMVAGDPEPTATPIPTMPPDMDEPEESEPPEDLGELPEEGAGDPDANLPTFEDPAQAGGEDPQGGDSLDGGMLAEAAGDDLTLAARGQGEDPATGEAETPPPPELEDTPEPISVVITQDPEEAPIKIDPIDKPTEAPVVAVYRPFTNSSLGITFDVPMLWSYFSSAEYHMSFYEPDADVTEGYPASLTVQAYARGSDQNAEDAKNMLLEIMEELRIQEWESFTYNNDTEATTMAKAKGHYAYYNATYAGTKVRGRVMVIAHGPWLYQVRISCPASRYGAYEEVFRHVRSSWEFM